MASTKLALLAVAVLLLHASWGAVAQPGSNAAVMTVTSFEQKDGGGPAACDDTYHFNWAPIAALSTEWYAGGSRCHKPIRITSSQNGRSVSVDVVDECDSQSGCTDNMIATSQAIWDALGLDTNIGEVPITWTTA